MVKFVETQSQVGLLSCPIEDCGSNGVFAQSKQSTLIHCIVKENGSAVFCIPFYLVMTFE